MRVATGSACAARPIAQMLCRVAAIAKKPSSSRAKVAEQGKVRVNRRWKPLLLAESGEPNQAA